MSSDCLRLIRTISYIVKNSFKQSILQHDPYVRKCLQALFVTVRFQLAKSEEIGVLTFPLLKVVPII